MDVTNDISAGLGSWDLILQGIKPSRTLLSAGLPEEAQEFWRVWNLKKKPARVDAYWKWKAHKDKDAMHELITSHLLSTET